MYDVYGHTCAVVDGLPKDEVLRFAGLFHDVGKPQTKSTDADGIGHFYGHLIVSEAIAESALRRLRASNALIAGVLPLVKFHDAEFVSRKSVKRMMGRLGVDKVRELLILRKADVEAQTLDKQPVKLEQLSEALSSLDKLVEEVACFKLSDLAVKGEDLLGVGFKQGRQIGQALNYLLELVLDEAVPNERDSLLAEAIVFRDS